MEQGGKNRTLETVEEENTSRHHSECRTSKHYSEYHRSKVSVNPLNFSEKIYARKEFKKNLMIYFNKKNKKSVILFLKEISIFFFNTFRRNQITETLFAGSIHRGLKEYNANIQK